MDGKMVSEIPDLTDTPLDQLMATGNPVLDSITKKVIADQENSDGIVAGFNSAI